MDYLVQLRPRVGDGVQITSGAALPDPMIERKSATWGYSPNFSVETLTFQDHPSVDRGHLRPEGEPSCFVRPDRASVTFPDLN